MIDKPWTIVCPLYVQYLSTTQLGQGKNRLSKLCPGIVHVKFVQFVGYNLRHRQYLDKVWTNCFYLCRSNNGQLAAVHFLGNLSNIGIWSHVDLNSD